MLNVVYLVLVTIYGSSVSTIKIPQVNIKQCEINSNAYNKIVQRDDYGDRITYKATCIVGGKE